MVATIKGECDQAFPNHGQNGRDAAKVERGLGQNGLTGEQRLRYSACQTDRPIVVSVIAVGKRHEESGVSDAVHVRENPFRRERFLGPRMLPARRMNDWAALLALAFSNWSRTILPCGRP